MPATRPARWWRWTAGGSRCERWMLRGSRLKPLLRRHVQGRVAGAASGNRWTGGGPWVAAEAAPTRRTHSVGAASAATRASILRQERVLQVRAAESVRRFVGDGIAVQRPGVD